VRYGDPSGLKECCDIYVRCHGVPETGNIGVHCYFVARDGDGTYHTISGHASNGIGGTVVVSDIKTPQMPGDPGSWPINHTPDPDCTKTNCLIDLARLFTALKLEYRLYTFNSTSIASQLAKGCGINVSFPWRGFGVR
jgi:hypothetical protein